MNEESFMRRHAAVSYKRYLAMKVLRLICFPLYVAATVLAIILLAPIGLLIEFVAFLKNFVGNFVVSAVGAFQLIMVRKWVTGFSRSHWESLYRSKVRILEHPGQPLP